MNKLRGQTSSGLYLFFRDSETRDGRGWRASGEAEKLRSLEEPEAASIVVQYFVPLGRPSGAEQVRLSERMTVHNGKGEMETVSEERVESRRP